MARFCGKCGEKVLYGRCEKCGEIYMDPYDAFLISSYKRDVTQRILINVFINCVVWILIAFYQWDNYLYGIAIWNVAMCICELCVIYDIKKYPDSFIHQWRSGLVGICLFCIINLFLHSEIGVVLNLHMLYIRHIVLKNEMILKRI